MARVVEGYTEEQVASDSFFIKKLGDIARGRKMIEKRLPGLTTLWQASSLPEYANTLDHAALSLQFGLYLAAFSDLKVIGMNQKDREILISRAIKTIEPDLNLVTSLTDERSKPSFQEQLDKIKSAYAVVGQRAAGKGTFLDMLKTKGVYCTPSSASLRDYVSYTLQETLVPVLIETGKQLKEQFGDDVLIKWSLLRAFEFPEDQWRRVAIDGLRTEAEIISFKSLFGKRAKVVAIISDPDIMWDRLLRRQIETGRVDFKTKEEFLASLAEEYQRIEKIISTADVKVNNLREGEGGLRELEQSAVRLLHDSIL